MSDRHCRRSILDRHELERNQAMPEHHIPLGQERHVPTVRVVCQCALPPDRVLAAAHDFSERRSAIFSAVQLDRLVVHSHDETTADVTEGTRSGPIVNWERCDYDWSQPNIVVANVTNSNIYEPAGSRWEITATATETGSAVVMTWIRAFRRTPKGRLFNFVFKRFGQRLFNKYGKEIVEHLEQLDRVPDPHPRPASTPSRGISAST